WLRPDLQGQRPHAGARAGVVLRPGIEAAFGRHPRELRRYGPDHRKPSRLRAPETRNRLHIMNAIRPEEPRRFPRSEAGLTPEMAQAFAEDGYLVVEDFMPAQLCDDLQTQAKALVEAFDAAAHATVFSTSSESHARDAYFQESGDKIRFFFEEE